MVIFFFKMSKIYIIGGMFYYHAWIARGNSHCERVLHPLEGGSIVNFTFDTNICVPIELSLEAYYCLFNACRDALWGRRTYPVIIQGFSGVSIICGNKGQIFMKQPLLTSISLFTLGLFKGLQIKSNSTLSLAKAGIFTEVKGKWTILN